VCYPPPRMGAPRVTVEVRAREAEALEIMAREVREGLTRVPKEIPSKHFYDERGSHLFEEITLLPEYYLTRAEQALLARKSAEIAAVARPETLIELGPGSARKTRMLLEAGMSVGTLHRYVPVEVAEARWVPLDEAPRLLSYGGERQMALAAAGVLAEGSS